MFSIYSFPFVICLMIVVCKTSWNQRSQTNFHGIKYINLIYIYIYTYYSSPIFGRKLRFSFRTNYTFEEDYQMDKLKLLSACGAINFVGGNRHNSAPWTKLFVFPIALISWERYEANYSFSNCENIIEQTGLFHFNIATDLGEGKLWIQTW